MTKVMSKKELANAYGVHTNTLMKWVKEIPELKHATYKKLLTPKQVQLIFDKIGNPA